MSNIELIYHGLNSNNEINSPFATKIIDITNKNDILIVSPYISISFLKYLTGKANSWKLISDIEEWLKSSKSDILEISSFIKNNSGNIHHFKDIHAKVVISKNSAVFGSANLTEKGLTGRVELSVLLKQMDKVEELKQWFFSLWSITEEVNLSELSRFGKEISFKKIDPVKLSTKLTSISPIIKSKIPSSFFNNQTLILKEDEENFYNQLVNAVKKLKSENWVISYFELASKLIEFTKIQNDDPRLAMMINSKQQIPIGINRGYVLKPYKTGEIGLMMPMDYKKDNFKKDKVSYEDPKRFYKNGIQIARYLKFDCKDGINLTKDVLNCWKKAVLTELKRARATSMRKYHKSIVFKVIIDKNFRQEVINDAFG